MATNGFVVISFDFFHGQEQPRNFLNSLRFVRDVGRHQIVDRSLSISREGFNNILVSE